MSCGEVIKKKESKRTDWCEGTGRDQRLLSLGPGVGCGSRPGTVTVEHIDEKEKGCLVGRANPA